MKVYAIYESRPGARPREFDKVTFHRNILEAFIHFFFSSRKDGVLSMQQCWVSDDMKGVY